MATPIKSTTSKQSTAENCNDASDLEENIARISIDGAAAALNEDDVTGTESNTHDGDEINSSIPTEFNDIDHIFHIDFMRSMQSLISQQEKRYNSHCRSISQ